MQVCNSPYQSSFQTFSPNKMANIHKNQWHNQWQSSLNFLISQLPLCHGMKVIRTWYQLPYVRFNSLDMFQKYGKKTQIIHLFIGFWNHYFHHPFWGIYMYIPLIFGSTSISNIHFRDSNESPPSHRLSIHLPGPRLKPPLPLLMPWVVEAASLEPGLLALPGENLLSWVVPPPRMPVANEGLGWDPLPKM